MTGDAQLVGPSRHRQLSGPLRYVQAVVLGAIPILGFAYIAGLHTTFGLLIFAEQWIGLFYSLCLVGLFLTFPPTAGASRAKVAWYDKILVLVAVVPGGYLALRYPDIALDFAGHGPVRSVASVLGILLILEGLRRTVGWTLVFVVLAFIVYARYGAMMPGPLAAQPMQWPRLLNYLYVDPNAVLGMLRLAATIALAFIAFGQLLLHFGAGDSLTRVALLVFGRFRGGPAKGSMLGSSMVGTITGAPMSNVFLTGNVTIPMMIRAGYGRATAAGIEATVSTGGQIMPPVMGVAAFIIADNLGVPYTDVALAALIPALLFYLGVYTQIDLEAGKRQLRGLLPDERPRLRETVQKGWVIAPVLAILIYTLFIVRMNPANAAVFSTVFSVPFLFLVRSNRREPLRRIARTLEGSGRLLLDVSLILAAAGLVVGIASASGLGFRIGYTVVQSAELGGVWVALIIAAIASIFLGMGMPSVAAYALVAVLVAPALTDFGISPMAAHLFIFYFAIVSNITPPIAVAAFAAAPLAGATSMKTALEAMRVGIVIYIVPFLFVFTPAILLEGEVGSIVLHTLFAAAAVVALGIALVGYLTRPLGLPSRAVAAIVALTMLVPVPDGLLVTVRGVGVLALVALVGSELMVQMRRRATGSVTTTLAE